MIMDKNTVRKYMLSCVAFLVILACEVPLLATPPVSNPSPAPGAIETIVVATAGAAQTQTAQVMPSPTITSTSTPLPTATPTETPTSTPTVIFIIPTATKPFVTQSAGTGCQVVAQQPNNNAVFESREKFKTVWELKNTGDEYWSNTDVDFRHSGGTDMHGADALDLPVNVAPGTNVTLSVNMVAPKNPGTYTTNWVLGSKKSPFCKVSVTIVVK